MRTKVENLVVLITGGTRGVGLGIASILKQNQCILVLNGRSDNLMQEESVSKLEDFSYLPANISNAQDRVYLINETIKRYGRLDVLVNNAFCSYDANVSNPLTNCFDKNVDACYHLCELAFPYLSNSTNGNIINISSASGVLSMAAGNSIPYAISKAAINHLSRLLAKNYAPKVRVNSISPTIVHTKRTSGKIDALNEFKDSSALGYLVSPEDIGEMVISLISCLSITGQDILIDSGLSL